jgi:hypothetical protein
MEVEFKIKTPKIRTFKEEIREIIRDKVTLTMAATMAAAETILMTESHLNAK